MASEELYIGIKPMELRPERLRIGRAISQTYIVLAFAMQMKVDFLVLRSSPLAVQLCTHRLLKSTLWNMLFDALII